MTHTTLRLVCSGALATLLAACATAPRPLQGEFATVRPIDAESATGSRIRWGGSVIAVETRSGETCFEILGRELNSNARPRRQDASDGRFLACRRGFYDPAIFTPGRDITVTGAVRGSEVRKVGQYDYNYPRVDAEAVYLWPARSEVIVEHRPSPFFFHSPFWYGGYGWGIHHRRHW